MRNLLIAVAVLGVGIGVAVARGDDKPAEPAGIAQFASFADLKWEKIEPELGDASPERAVVHQDEKTKAMKLFIRTPKGLHVKRHWHTANETHTVIKGEWTFTCDRCGKHVKQGPGDFNVVPAKCIHQAWSSDGAVVFITVDSAFDINWVDGPSTKEDLGVKPPADDEKK